MKIRIDCDSGANIKSNKSWTIDLENDFGICDKEWKDEMSDDEKYALVEEFVWQHGLYIGWEDIK